MARYGTFPYPRAVGLLQGLEELAALVDERCRGRPHAVHGGLVPNALAFGGTAPLPLLPAEKLLRAFDRRCPQFLNETGRDEGNLAPREVEDEAALKFLKVSANG